MPFGTFISNVNELIDVGKQMKNCLVQRSNIEKYTHNILKHKWNIYHVKESEQCLFSINKKCELLEAEAVPQIPYDLASDDYSFFDQPTPENDLCREIDCRLSNIRKLIRTSRKIYSSLSSKEQLLYIYKYGYIIKMLPVDYNIFTNKSLCRLPPTVRNKIIMYVRFGLTCSAIKQKVYERLHTNLSEFST